MTVGLLAGLFLAALDATIVGTSMPTITAHLRGLSIYFLAFSGFLVCQVVSIPIFGRFADLYGRGRLYLSGLAIFVAASMLCGLSRSMPELIAWRSVQGVGAGCLMSISFTMIGDLYPLEERARLQGVISAVWGVASLIGPPVGGFITQRWGWPWIFYVNAPFGLVAALLVRSAWKDEGRPAAPRPDLAGAALLALAAAALLAAFTAAGRGMSWNSPAVAGLFGAAAVLLALLSWVERRAAAPFLRYELYRKRLFAAGSLTGCCAATILFATTTYLPLFVQGVLGDSPTRAGLILVPMMVPWIVCSALGGLLILRFGYRTLAVAGMALCTAGYLLLARLGSGAGWWSAGIPLLFVGAGLGLTITPLLIAAQNSVPRSDMGAATSLMQFTRTMGGAMGVAVMGAVLSTTLLANRPAGPAPSPDDIVDPVRRRVLSPAEVELWRVPLAKGIRGIFWLGVAAGIAGSLVALAIPGGRARDHVLETDEREAER